MPTAAPAIGRFQSALYTRENPFVTYWNSWLATRSRLNEYVLKQRMAALAPHDRMKEMEALRRQIGDLTKLKGDILRDGAKAHGTILNSMVQGSARIEASRGAADAARVKGEAEIAKTRLQVAGEITTEAMKQAGRRAESTPGPETFRLARVAAGELTGLGGAIPADPGDVAKQALLAALTKEGASLGDEKGDRIALGVATVFEAARQEALQQGNAEAAKSLELAARTVSQDAFGTPELPQAFEQVQAQYPDLDVPAAIQEALKYGGLPQAEPRTSESRGGGFKVSVAGGAKGPAAPAGAPGGAAMPMPEPAAAAGAPGLQPDVSAFAPSGDMPDIYGESRALAESLTPAITGAEGEFARLEAAYMAERERQAAAGPFPGFTRNVLTEPLMAAPTAGPNQRMLDLVAGADPMRLQAVLDALGEAGGDPVKALAAIRAQGGLPGGAPRFGGFADPGQPVMGWFATTLGDASAGLASDDPASQVDGLRLLNEAAQAMEANSTTVRTRAPGMAFPLTTALEEALKPRPDSAALQGALGQAWDAARTGTANDIHFSELLADEAGTVLGAPTPEAKLEAAKAFASWTARQPPSLAGQWKEVAPRAVTESLSQGRGRDLMRDLENMRNAGYAAGDRYMAAQRQAREVVVPPVRTAPEPLSPTPPEPLPSAAPRTAADAARLGAAQQAELAKLERLFRTPAEAATTPEDEEFLRRLREAVAPMPGEARRPTL